MLQFQRVHWLHPFLWSLAFAFAAAVISRKSRAGVFVAVLLIVLQVGMVIRAGQAHNYDQVHSCHGNPEWRLTFSEFFSAPLFAEIKNYIGRPQNEYRVASLGMYPSIALYNGFYTADGYVQNYPLEYKHRFRKVIAQELAKSPSLRQFFDNWGSCCYLLSHELGRLLPLGQTIPGAQRSNISILT